MAYKMLLAIFLSSGLFTGRPKPVLIDPIYIQGVVVAENTGKPLSNIHVYVIEGEEESVTNEKGAFRITSWQKLPVKLTATSSNYKTFTTTVKDAGKKLVIKLQSK